MLKSTSRLRGINAINPYISLLSLVVMSIVEFPFAEITLFISTFKYIRSPLSV